MPSAALMLSKAVIGKKVGEEKQQHRKVLGIATNLTKGWGIPIRGAPHFPPIVVEE
jgi:hypothetical protein